MSGRFVVVVVVVSWETTAGPGVVGKVVWKSFHFFLDSSTYLVVSNSN